PRRQREILRAGSDARGRPRCLVMADRRPSRLCVRRCQTHGEGRRGRAGRHRRPVRGALGRSSNRLRYGPEEARPIPTRCLLNEVEDCALTPAQSTAYLPAWLPTFDTPMNTTLLPPEPVQTTCPYCGVGCGVLATPNEQGDVAIAGDPAHPASFGRLCSNGGALDETLGSRSRL